MDSEMNGASAVHMEPPKTMPPVSSSEVVDHLPSKTEGAVYEALPEHSLEIPEPEISNISSFKANSAVTAATEEVHLPSEGNAVSVESTTFETQPSVNGVNTAVNGHASIPEQPASDSNPPSSPPHGDLPTLTETQEISTSATSPPSSAPLISEPASSFPTEPLGEHLDVKPAAEEPRLSDLRSSPVPVPVTSDEALRIKSENHQQDLAADSELAEGLTVGGNDPIERTLASEVQPQPTEPTPAAPEDKMDLSADAPAPSTAPADSAPAELAPVVPPIPTSDAPVEEAPIDPAPTPAVPSSSDHLQVDQPMVDVPTSPGKVAREREDDGEDEERAAKRAKPDQDMVTETPETAGPQGVEAEFKVPEVPQTTQPAPLENGDSEQAPTTESDDNPMTSTRQKFLIKQLQNLKRSQDARFYKEPVDPIKLNIPTYPEFVKEPMDISTIEKKLKGNEYSSVNQVVAHFELMLNNAATFNGPDHVVAVEGQKLKAVFDKQMKNLPPPDVIEPSKAEKKAQKVSVPTRSIPARRESNARTTSARSPTGTAASPTQTFALKPDGVPLIRRDSTVADGRPKREIHPPKYRENIMGGGRPKKKKYQWQLKWCQEVLNEFKKAKHWNDISFFAEPVDPVALNIPQYHNVIKKPMDLHTVQDKLSAGQYENAKDFEADVRLIFRNCFKFNVKGDAVFSAGQRVEKLFEEKWEGKDQWLESHEPPSGPQSPGADSSEEEFDEEEDADSEEEDRAARITALQKQIAAMSEQVKGLSQPAPKKKKVSPPAPAKKGAKKGDKKELKKKASFSSAAAPKDKKKPKHKTEKDRFVTYNEKQYISSGISSLGDAEMQSALRIIQANVPSLKNIHESEIELDIDELPNNVLIMLLKFLKKHIPEPPPEEPAPEPPVVASAASRPKKNKPMTKHEQEAQIRELQGKLNRFESGTGGLDGSPDPVARSIEQAVDSSGDDDSEESEEE